MNHRAIKTRDRRRSILAGLVASILVLVMFPVAGAQAVLQPGVSGLSRAAAVEGIVMLKNDNNALPLSASETVSVFGRVQINYFAVGYGSGGDVKTPYRTNLLTGLRRNPGIKINETLASQYETWTAANVPSDGSWGTWPTNYPEMPLTQAQVDDAAAASDKAVVVIGRSAGEDRESTNTAGSYLLTNDEKDMLAKVTAKFDKVVVLINAGNLIDMTWMDTYPNIDSVMYVWQGGMESGAAVADVLSGDESPSGKLPQTIGLTLQDYPSYANFGVAAYNNYAEDIFVGYRYFETFAKNKVRYPFGFGLSYTTFTTTTNSVTEADGKITVDVTVKNTGTKRGKEVVQVYYGAPQGELGKAAKSLAAYAKTSALQPGASENIKLTFSVKDMASYDDGNYTGHDSAWVLEAGDYPIYVGNDVRSAAQAGVHNEPALRVTEQMYEASAPRQPFKRWHASEVAGEVVLNKTSQDVPTETPNQLKPRITADLPIDSPNLPLNQGNQGIKLIDVYKGDKTMDEFISQMTQADLVNLTRGAGAMGHNFGIPGNASVFGGTNTTLRDTYGIPAMSTTDGPSGIRMSGQASLIPIGTLLAATWNDRLVEELYAGVGKEMLLNGSDSLLAPGMNIQRDPRLGRNFEYFSEDPLLTGKMGVATIRGLQSEGVSATPKHFAANNQETARHSNDSRVSERAQREIYLKGFEIALKSANPYTLMMSYNKLNGTYTYANYDLAVTILRKQWGYTGTTMTDWWIDRSACADTSLTATNLVDNQCRVRGGTDVLMPGDRENEGNPGAAVTAGNLNIGEVQRAAKSTLEFAMLSSKFRTDNNLPLEEYTPGAQWFDVDQPQQGDAPRVTAINIDGKPLSGFSPLTTEYTIYAKNLDPAPVVTYEAPNDLTVTISQATSTKRFASILVVAADGAQTRYRINWSDDPTLPLPEGATRAKINSLSLNGQTFLPFYQDTFNYTIPNFNAADATIGDVITPAGVTAVVLPADVDGRIIVRAESAEHRRDYVFTFTPDTRVAPQSDDFSGTTLKNFWTVDNQTSKYTKPDGSVQIETEGGEWYQTGSNLHNTVWQQADGNWSAITKFDFDKQPFQSYHQLGVVVYQDENNFLEFQLEYNNWNGTQATPLQFAVKNETNAASAATAVTAAPSFVDTSPVAGPAGSVYMKVTKTGNAYQFAFSKDGVTYTSVGTTFTKAMAQPKFGLQALHGGNGATVDAGGGPTAGQPMVPIKVNYDSVTFSGVELATPTIPTGPIVPITAAGTSKVMVATDSFFMTSGLQTEACSGACTGRNLGYTSPGAYTVGNIDVAEAGFYNVVPQIAANATVGGVEQLGFTLNVNGELGTTFNKGGGTGGWQTWEKLPSQMMYLNAGLNKLQLYFNTAGMNFGSIEFTKSTVNRTALSAAIATAGNLTPGDYTPLSWATLNAALTTAKSVNTSGAATQVDVNAAATALEQALAGLRTLGHANTDQLVGTAPAINALVASGVLRPADYTAASWNAFTGALDAVNALLADDQDMLVVTQAEVNALATALNDSLTALSTQRVGDNTVLTALATEIAGQNLTEAIYTPSSWSALQSALTTANAVVGAESTQAQINTAFDDLLSAFTGLVVVDVVDFALLDNAINASAGKVSQSADYTKVSWTAFASALASAKAVRSNASSTQQQVDTAQSALVSAIAGLKPVPVVAPKPPVKAATVSAVRVAQKSLTLVRKKSATVPAVVYFSNGKSSTKKGDVTWKSSNKKIAKVNSKTGKIVAVRPGTVTITVTAKKKNASGKAVSAKIKVKVVTKAKPSVKKVSAKAPKTLAVGKSVKVAGKYTPTTATGVKITYRSSKTSVLTIDRAGTVVAKKAGTAKITVKAGKKSKTYTIRVRGFRDEM